MDYRASHNKERGAALIMTAGFMLLAILCLGLVIDTGRLYVEKRNLQRIADISALEVASRRGCSNGQAQAIANSAASRNGFNNSATQSISASCGFISIADNARQFSASGSNTDAVQITVQRQVPASLIAGGLFRNNITISARATALSSQPTVVFRIGSKLISANTEAPVMSLLKSIGLNVNTLNVASYGGLANVNITPSGLLNALGIPITANLDAGGLNELLAVNQVAVGDVLDAIVTVAGQDALVSTNATLLQALNTQLGVNDVKVQLGTDPSINSIAGLFAVIDTTGSSALNVGVNALGLLTSTLGIATKDSALALDLGGNNLLTGLKAGVRLIEPQSVGVGGVGATANNAQLRINVNLDSTQGLTGVLGSIAAIKLPLTIDTVQAVATVTQINCDSSPRTVVLRVESAVANACVGRISPSALWSTKDVCASSLQDETFVRLAGATVLRGQVILPVLPATPEDITLEVGQTKTTKANTLKIGDLVSDLLSELLGLLGNSDFGDGSLTAAEATEIADGYLALPALAPTGSGGKYTNSNLSAISTKLDNDGINWSRPGFLFLLSSTMLNDWESSVKGSCGFSTYTASCVRTKLISALQTDAQNGLVGGLISGLLGGLVKPLLNAVLSPVIALLQGPLNAIGSLVSNLLSNVIGIDVTRSDVTLDSLSCGTPELVI